LTENSRLLAEITFKVKASHSRYLMDAIQNVLEQVDWDPNDLAALAVTRGPGSFTGLRIGISAMKGLAVGLGKPLAGISTLEALAAQCQGTSKLICPMLDGRRGEVFTNQFRYINGVLTTLGEDRSLTPKKALKEIKAPCLIIGNGARLYRELIQREIPQWACFGSSIQHRIHGVTIARMAEEALAADKPCDPARLTPQYIRKPDATLPKIKQSPIE
jgi:tRNA threonylcarbamoyladenosine biosynthesis protein TsaB